MENTLDKQKQIFQHQIEVIKGHGSSFSLEKTEQRLSTSISNNGTIHYDLQKYFKIYTLNFNCWYAFLSMHNTWLRFSTHLIMKGIESLGEIGPNISDSNDILRMTLLTMSPRYIPDIIFSKPCTQISKILVMTNQATGVIRCRNSPDHLDLGSQHPSQCHTTFLVSERTKSFPIPYWQPKI